MENILIDAGTLGVYRKEVLKGPDDTTIVVESLLHDLTVRPIDGPITLGLAPEEIESVRLLAKGIAPPDLSFQKEAEIFDTLPPVRVRLGTKPSIQQRLEDLEHRVEEAETRARNAEAVAQEAKLRLALALSPRWAGDPPRDSPELHDQDN